MLSFGEQVCSCRPLVQRNETLGLMLLANYHLPLPPLRVQAALATGVSALSIALAPAAMAAQEAMMVAEVSRMLLFILYFKCCRHV